MSQLVWFGCALFFVGAILAVILGITAFVLLARAPGQPPPPRKQMLLGVLALLGLLAIVAGGVSLLFLH
jgi:hypothetical protein